jgi:hypothetical protein
VAPDQAIILAVANGERRNPITASILQGAGVRAGASDLIVAATGGRTLWCEVKVAKSALHKRTYPSKAQQAFRTEVEALGHRYALIYSEWDLQDLLDELGLRLRFHLVGPRPPH